jgi:hypothetical protein
MLVKSAPHALVLDIDHMNATGRRRYVGRAVVQGWSEDDLPDDCPAHMQANQFLEPGQKPIPHTAYPLSGAEAVPITTYYTKALTQGDLLPADHISAAAAGVKVVTTRKKEANG